MVKHDLRINLFFRGSLESVVLEMKNFVYFIFTIVFDYDWPCSLENFCPDCYISDVRCPVGKSMKDTQYFLSIYYMAIISARWKFIYFKFSLLPFMYKGNMLFVVLSH